MRMFLILYFLVYGMMTGCFAWRTGRAFQGEMRLVMVLASLMVGIGAMLLPFAGRSIEGSNRLTGEILSVLGFTWLIWMFWFFFLSVGADVWNGAIWLAGRWIAPQASVLRVAPRVFLFAAGATILLATIWGLVESKSLRVRPISVTDASGRLEQPVRLLFITDLHIGHFFATGHLSEVVRLAEELEPDLIVSGGDLIDRNPARLDEEAEALAHLSPSLGKFAVMGNHEFYLGIEKSQSWHEKAGFRILRGEAVELPNGIRLIGVDDPAAERTLQGHRTLAEPHVLPPREEAASERPFTLLLKHQPAVEEATRGRIDLQLSGHIHGGQVWPFGLVIRFFHPYPTGRHELPEGGVLYVSPGTGTWGTPLRVGARPELTLLTIEPESTGDRQTSRAAERNHRSDYLRNYEVSGPKEKD